MSGSVIFQIVRIFSWLHHCPSQRCLLGALEWARMDEVAAELGEWWGPPRRLQPSRFFPANTPEPGQATEETICSKIVLSPLPFRKKMEFRRRFWKLHVNLCVLLKLLHLAFHFQRRFICCWSLLGSQYAQVNFTSAGIHKFPYCMLHLLLYESSSWRNNPGPHSKIFCAFIFFMDSLKGLLSLYEHLFDWFLQEGPSEFKCYSLIFFLVLTYSSFSQWEEILCCITLEIADISIQITEEYCPNMWC